MRLIGLTLSVLALSAVASAQRPGSDEVVIPQPDPRVGLCEPFGCSVRIQTENFGDGPIYVDGTPTADGVTLVTDQFGVQPSLGMSVGFAGQFLGPFSR